MPLLSLNSLIQISKKNTESQEAHNVESQNSTNTNIPASSRKRPRITFDDDYDNDNSNNNRASRPSLSFRDLGMLDSAATPTMKRRKSKTPLKKKKIKRSPDDSDDENGDGDAVGSLESEEVEIIFEDGPSERAQQQLTRNRKTRLPDVDPESFGMLYNDYDNDSSSKTKPPTSSLPDDLLQNMMRVLEPAVPNPFKHISRVERLQPKSRQNRKRHHHHLKVWETPQDAKIRVLKYDRRKEWLVMKGAVKNRMYDYTKEVDVGGAITKMARRVLQETYEKEQSRTKRETKLKKWAAKLQDDNVDAATTTKNGQLLSQENQILHEDPYDGDDHHSHMSDESSVDEQKQVLERLQQSQPTENEEQKEADATQTLLSELETPFASRLTYWERGKVKPPTLEFDFMDRQHVKGAFIPQAIVDNDSDDHDHDDHDSGKLRMSMQELLITFRMDILKGDSFYHFPWRRNTGNAKNDVGTYMRHFRQLRRLSYRYLCGGSKTGNVHVENRLIRLLQSTFREPHGKQKAGYQFHQSHHGALLQLLARRQGKDLQIYLQSRWINQAEVARRLGLIYDPRHAYHCSGWIMNRVYIGGFGYGAMKLRRQLEGQEKISEMPWDHQDDEYNRHEEPDMNGIAAYPEVVQIVTESNSNSNPNSNSVPAEHSDAVMPDVATSASDLEGLNVAARNPVNKYKALDEEDIWNKTIVKPTCAYMHVAGTTPPIPNFPLDVVGIIFGPADRFARFTHPVRLDETFFKVTLSTLLSRMGAAEGKEERRGISAQIDKLVTEFPKLHLKGGYKLLPSRKRSDGDLPLVACYNAITSYCSYMANGCSMKKVDDIQVFKRDDDDDLYGDDSGNGKNDDDFMDEKDIADEIYDYCDSFIGHNGLQRFPKIHVTFALARLCTSLPKSAAEILSRPLDERNQRTPFDLFKIMLEHLERDDLIVDTQHEAVDGKIMGAELEYLILDAAEVFKDCVKLNPVDAINHAWHIGALSACLLLCSGNQIGSGTRLYPSAKKKKRHGVDMQFQDDDSPWHEIRLKLGKFLDVRMELAKAVRLLFHLAKYQKGPRVSLAISSLLEWREVVGLLVGPTEQEPWDAIMALHKKHVMKWAIDSIMPISQTYIARQERDESASVQFRGRELENNPGSIESWRRFVQVLGPIGSQPNTQEEQHHGKNCLECKRLREGLFINHMARSDCRRNKKWLCADRFKTWNLVLLHIPACPVVDTSAGKPRRGKASRLKPDATVKSLNECMPKLKESLSSLFELDDYVVVEDGDEELSWLPFDTNTENEDLQFENENPKSEKSDVERSQTFDRILPRTFVEVLSEEEEEEEETEFDPPQLTGPKALTLEIMCYKIIILCHMHDMYDNDVETALKTLVIQSWNENGLQKNSDEWRSLLWLCAMGLNIPYIITRWVPFKF